jgi:starch synthase
MDILFVAAEANPLIKVGGLADVIGSLPGALNELGHDVRVLLPKYRAIDLNEYKTEPGENRFITKDGQTEDNITLRICRTSSNISFYLIENSDYFDTMEIYSGNALRRFLFFCRAATEVVPELRWKPDIIHCHDWHTALVPLLLKSEGYRITSLFTIHNLAHQGAFNKTYLRKSGLLPYWSYRCMPDSPEPKYNFMSQGILCADMVTTVSENYAKEIVTKEHGEGLDNLLRYRGNSLVGITNGIDYDEYNPGNDMLIPATYDISRLELRLQNKTLLQERAHLPQGEHIPLIGMVSRLVEQKGLDILIKSIDSLCRMPVQLVILGKGSDYYHDLLRKASNKYPDKLAVFIDFDNSLAHLIYAGCDMFLMPSQFEPCGLGQMIAMRYGAVPIVRFTGGLADTVQDLTPDSSSGSGFVFREYNRTALLNAVQRAVSVYSIDKQNWYKIMRRIMSIDFSWSNSARKYELLYRNAMSGGNCEK